MNGFNNQIKTLSQLKRGVRTMVVRARVISKGSIKHNSLDKFLKIEIYDGSLDFTTLVIFSCPNCEDIHDHLQVGRVYKFSKGLVSSDAQKSSQRNCLKYDMFDPSYIQLINPEDETPEEVKTLNFDKYEFVKINQITDIHSTQHFDVIDTLFKNFNIYVD